MKVSMIFLHYISIFVTFHINYIKCFSFKSLIKKTKFIVPLIAISNIDLFIPTYKAFAEDNIIETRLTAADVLKSDLDPKIDTLKDIFFIIKLYPSYLDSKDYQSIRQSLRQEPLIETRKTCRKIVKYLPENQVSSFNKAYNNMIEKLNDLDVLALRRIQGTDLPSDLNNDIEMKKIVSEFITTYELMLKSINAI